MTIEVPTLIEFFDVDHWARCHPEAGGSGLAGNLLTEIEPHREDPDNPGYMINSSLGNGYTHDYPHAWTSGIWNWIEPGPDTSPYLADAAPYGLAERSMGIFWPPASPTTLLAAFNTMHPWWTQVEPGKTYVGGVHVAGRYRRNPGQSLTAPTSLFCSARIRWIKNTGQASDYAGLADVNGFDSPLIPYGNGAHPWKGDPVPDRFSECIGRMGYNTAWIKAEAPAEATHCMLRISLARSYGAQADIWFAAPFLMEA